MECEFCGKEYKRSKFLKKHIRNKHSDQPKEKHEEIKVEKVIKSKVDKVKVTGKSRKSKVEYRELVYVGTADQATAIGAVTSKKYTFSKDKYKMPVPTKIDEKDYPGIVALKGKGCVRRDPTALYMSKLDWDLELESAKVVNS